MAWSRRCLRARRGAAARAFRRPMASPWRPEEALELPRPLLPPSAAARHAARSCRAGLCSAADIDVTCTMRAAGRHRRYRCGEAAARLAQARLRMHRLGLDPDSFRNARRQLAALPGDGTGADDALQQHARDGIARDDASDRALQCGHRGSSGQQVSAANSAVFDRPPCCAQVGCVPDRALWRESAGNPASAAAARRDERARDRHCRRI